MGDTVLGALFNLSLARVYRGKAASQISCQLAVRVAAASPSMADGCLFILKSVFFCFTVSTYESSELMSSAQDVCAACTADAVSARSSKSSWLNEPCSGNSLYFRI